MNQQAMLRRVRQLQKEALETKQEIDNTEFRANCGPVSMVMLGDKTVKEVIIDKDFTIEDDSDRELLADSVVAASHQLINEIDKFTEEKMSKYSAMLGGMGGF